jgi:hypothetical protein
MADIGPKAELKTLGNDFAIAEPDDTRLRHPLIPAFEHFLILLMAHHRQRVGGLAKS